MTGTKLGRYRIGEQLGEGGMGTVWRAEDTVLGRAVALKLLAPHLAASPEARQRFVREARAASRLEHTGIASVHDVGEADGQVYIAYQLIEGRTLASRLKEGPLAGAELLGFARLAGEALAHAHGRGVLHRDLTAGNLMLRPDGSPVIVDFGLARSLDDVTLTRTGTTLGTARYLAPEQWRNGQADARSDLWSLGVVFYEAATGESPFPGDTPETVMFHVLNDEPVKPTKLRPEVPPGFERVTLRLLEKDTRDRPASAAEVAAALRALERQLEEARAVPQPGERLDAKLRRWWRKLKRRPFGLVEVTVLLVAVGVVAAGIWFARQRAEANRERVLAVMPLRNASPDVVETAYIAEGLGQELVRRLGEAGGFRILPWSTTAAFAVGDRTPKSLAQELRADVVLMGSFNSEGERIQVLAELVDGRTGLQLWSERIVRTTGDLIGLQTALATTIAERVGRGRGEARARRIAETTPASPEAYEHYLRGASYLHSNDEEQKAFAEPLFSRAIELDPKLALAWVGLGGFYTDRYYTGAAGGFRNLLQADSCFRRARELAPDLPEVQRGLISVASELGEPDQVLEIAGETLRRGGSRLDALVTAGWGLTLAGFPDLAGRVLDRAVAEEPNNQGASWYRVLALGWSAEFKRCEEAGRAYVRRFGEDQEVYTLIAFSLGALGDREQAIVFLRRAVEMSRTAHYSSAHLAVSLLAMGRRQEANALLDSTITRYSSIVEAYPDNMRVRCYLATLMTLRGRVRDSDAEAKKIVTYLQAGGTATGGMEPDLPFSAASTGDHGRSRRLAAQLPITEKLWVNWVSPALLFEHGAIYPGEGSETLRHSLEYVSIRKQVDAHRARRLNKYRPLVERALRR
jgi:TolB-like protein/Tfp pilus assembly protein PilF